MVRRGCEISRTTNQVTLETIKNGKYRGQKKRAKSIQHLTDMLRKGGVGCSFFSLFIVLKKENIPVNWSKYEKGRPRTQRNKNIRIRIERGKVVHAGRNR